VSQKRAPEQTVVQSLYLTVKRSRGGGPATTPPETENKAIEDARAVLAHATSVDLPALEKAIAARDFDLALTCATALRAARALIRGQLGGGDIAGVLRTEWGKIEARLDAALLLAPRPGGDVEAASKQWKQRLARGTGSPEKARTQTVRARGSKPVMDAAPALDAVSNALDAEVYFAPTGQVTDDDFENETPTPRDPPTTRMKRRTRRPSR
jgi:hypothetical protein